MVPRCHCNLTKKQSSVIFPWQLKAFDAKVWRYLVYPKYWNLNLKPVMVCPKVLFPPKFITKGLKPALQDDKHSA